MKIKYLFTLLALCCSVAVQAATPSWVTSRPQSDDKYIGIARVSLSEDGCREKASKLALDEIAMQISVNTASESFMRMVVVDGRSKELFEKKVSQSVSLELEGQKIKDSYESNTHYYVYYELDKQAYYKSVERKRQSAVDNGFDLFSKGVAAEAAGNLTVAAQLYANGLDAVEPYLYLPLTTTYNGREFNVANELYNSYLNLFNGMVITTNMTEMSVEAFKADPRPIAACVSRNGKVLQNIELSADFVSGGGSITPAGKSDVNGTVVFYIKNITSKEPIQSLRISIGDSFLSGVSESYRSLLSGVNLPTATITLALKSSNYTAYFNVGRNDISSCEQYVKRLLANNYFELNESTSSDIFITYSTEFKLGSTVSGEISDLNECFCTLTVDIYNNKTQSMLLKYVIPELRVLVPTDQSATQAKATCARELVKRLNKEFPSELKKFNVNLK